MYSCLFILYFCSYCITVIISTTSTATTPTNSSYCFPSNFLFGTATAATQVEGGYLDYGRTFSIWDTACRKTYPFIQCSNVADDMINRYEEDIRTMSKMGLTSFRFSFSWSRVMTWNSKNQKMERNSVGIEYYHRFIDTLLNYHIEPLATMYHWDLPQALEDNIQPKGWLNRNITEHFVDYAKLLYTEYGSKILYWSTFNEPLTFVLGGYENGNQPPNVTGSDTSAYLAGHHVLLSHAYAVQLFHSMFPKSLNKKISIVLNCDYVNPLDPQNSQDIKIAQDVLDFTLGWFLNPVVYGDYPKIMREKAGKRLPQFTKEEESIIKGSYDIFMLNHYATHLTTSCNSTNSTISCKKLKRGWHYDLGADHNIVPPGAKISSRDENGNLNCKWFTGFPEGYLGILRHLHAYNIHTDILLTENGWCGNSTIDNLDQLWYHQTYLQAVAKALQEGIPIIGYTIWSFMDNYEWGSYKPRFGIHYVNFTSETGAINEKTPSKNALQRIPRITAKWYQHVAKNKCITVTNSYSKEANTTW